MHSLTVHDIQKLSDDAVSISINIPEDLKSDFQYISGQYITIEADINGESVRRAYSICSASHEEHVRVGVKRVEGGKMSNYLVNTLKAGNELNVMVPEGRFILKPDADKSRDHYFFAAGSGITPILSMIKSVLEDEPKSTCYLLYGNRDETSIMFKDELESLVHKYKDQLHIMNSLSQPQAGKKKGISGLFSAKSLSWLGLTGRLDADKVAKFMAEYPGENMVKDHFICGPGNMIESIGEALTARGVDKKSIHKEFFSSPDDKKSTTASAPSTNGMKKLTVHLEGEVFDLEIASDKNIVDALVEIGKDVPYSCSSGACSTCMAMLTKGKVEMESYLALDDEEVAQGYILACQACLVSDEAEVNFDL